MKKILFGALLSGKEVLRGTESCWCEDRGNLCTRRWTRYGYVCRRKPSEDGEFPEGSPIIDIALRLNREGLMPTAVQ